MDQLRRLQCRFDAYQQERTWLGFPVAVLKKFGDDEAGNLAALIAYYGFFSIFPLLLVSTTVLGYLLGKHEELREELVGSALDQLPILGGQIGSQVGSLHGSPLALAVGIAGALWGALAVAKTAQNAFNVVWEVPMACRPNLVASTKRSALLLVVGGSGVLLTTVVTGMSAGASSYALGLGVGIRVLAAVAALAINAAVFTMAFRLLTVRQVSLREVAPGAVVAAVFWQILQLVGGFYVTRTLDANKAYGTFAVVIGLLSLFYLQAQLTLVAAEVNVVLRNRLWPRALVDPPRTDADRRAYDAYQQRQRYDAACENLPADLGDRAPREDGPDRDGTRGDETRDRDETHGGETRGDEAHSDDTRDDETRSDDTHSGDETDDRGESRERSAAGPGRPSGG